MQRNPLAVCLYYWVAISDRSSLSSRGQTIVRHASLIRSPLWKHVRVLGLTVNMRLSNPALSPIERTRMSRFAQWVLDVGEGKVPAYRKDGETENTWINIPDDIVRLRSTYLMT